MPDMQGGPYPGFPGRLKAGCEPPISPVPLDLQVESPTAPWKESSGKAQQPWPGLSPSIRLSAARPASRWNSDPPHPDLPQWIGPQPRFADDVSEVEDEPMPLRYGIDLTPRGGCTPFPGRLPEPAGRGVRAGVSPAATLSAIRTASTGLVQFPHTASRAGSHGDEPQGALLQHGVLPFRSPVRQTITVFSLVGGTGRTCIAANLARLLASGGLRVLLADTCGYSVLPRFFGAREVRQGVVRHFLPGNGDRNRMISLVSLAVDAFAGDDCEQYRILEEITRDAAQVDRIIWDLSGAPLDWSAKVLCASPQILVPLLPDTHSLMQLRATERFLNRCHDEDPSPHLRYVLNHFNEMDPLHIDIRSRFRELLGSQMLPVTLRTSPLVDEALAKGRTVVDHAPASPLVGDLWRLAQQLNQIDVRKGFDSVAGSRSEWFEQ